MSTSSHKLGHQDRNTRKICCLPWGPGFGPMTGNPFLSGLLSKWQNPEHSVTFCWKKAPLFLFYTHAVLQSGNFAAYMLISLCLFCMLVTWGETSSRALCIFCKTSVCSPSVLSASTLEGKKQQNKQSWVLVTHSVSLPKQHDTMVTGTHHTSCIHTAL